GSTRSWTCRGDGPTCGRPARPRELPERAPLPSDVDGLAGVHGNRRVAAGAENFGTERRDPRLEADDGRAERALHLDGFGWRLRLVRRAATGHSGTGGGIEGQDVLFTHLCSSSSNEDREGGSWGAGGASESRGPVRRVFWMTWAAAPTIKRRPPVRR